MAFYAPSNASNDDNDLHIHTSPRSLSITISSNDVSDSSGYGTRSSLRYNHHSAVYVNSAAYIEKMYSPSDIDGISLTDEILGELDDIVPPLDIHSMRSMDSCPTTRLTYSYERCCEAEKIVVSPNEAYATWLSAKRKLKLVEEARKKKVEEQQREEREKRKRLNDFHFQRWLSSKSRQSLRSSCKSSTSQIIKPPIEPKKKRSPEELQANFEEWKRRKNMEAQRRRIAQREEEERIRSMEEQRQKHAAGAWEKWVIDVEKRPKPVPLNRGITTLRGTVSRIYINPNEWQHPVASDHKATACG